jgi:hypothetical protein
MFGPKNIPKNVNPIEIIKGWRFMGFARDANSEMSHARMTRHEQHTPRFIFSVGTSKSCRKPIILVTT